MASYVRRRLMMLAPTVLGVASLVFVLLRFVVTPIASPVLPVGTIVNAASSLPTSVVVEETPEPAE